MRTHAALFVVAALAGSGCGNSSTPVALLVSPATIAAAPGQLVPVHVWLRSADGNLADVTAQATLASSDAAVATVTGSSVALQGAGDAALVARARGLATFARIDGDPTIQAGTLTLWPTDALAVAEGHTLQLVVTGTGPDGRAVDLTGAARFGIDDPRVAALLAGGGGRVYGIAPGSVTVTATVGSATATTTVQVVAYAPSRKLLSLALAPRDVTTRVGAAAQLYAAARYDDGTIEDVTTRAAWRSDGGAIARIVGGTLVPAHGGSATVSATLEGQSDQVSATVIDLTSATLQPASLQLPVGGAQPLALAAQFADGVSFDLAAAADWSSDAPSLATVAGGTVSGLADGSTFVHATLFGRDVSAPVLVGDGTAAVDGGNGGTPVALAISPAAATIPVGGTQPFRAVATMSDGTQQPLAGVQWSADPGAAIDGNGVASATSAGTYAISARFGTLAATATLTVSPTAPHLVALTVSPPSLAMTVGDAHALVATAQYDDGSSADVTASATWWSSTAAVTVSAGLATAEQAGSAAVTARLGTLSASANVTVAPSVTSIAVSPSSGAAVPAGLSFAFSATAHYSDGSSADVTQSATWSSANTSVATVMKGSATGHTAGATQLTASFGGKAATVPFTVNPANVTALTVSGQSSITCSGSYWYYSAVATFSDGTQRDVSSSTSNPQVTWSLSGLSGYPGLYASDYGDELYCSSTCSSTCSYHYAYGSITATALNGDGTSVTAPAFSLQAAYYY